LVVVAAAVALGAITVVVVHESSGSGRDAQSEGAQPAVHRTATTTPATASTAPPPTTIDPGTLAQTDAFPSSMNAQFQSEMADLWQGIVEGSDQPALPAFFPETAYEQLKTIGDPRSDYLSRLVADFGADIVAAHQLLGATPAMASLVDVAVPEQYGHWIPPGVCDNGVGYFEVANARVVYQQGGQTRSFGIASLISWRGVWYVVHLGAILRPSAQGTVDDPELGPGTSENSTTC
jgi:hypothetical protein